MDEALRRGTEMLRHFNELIELGVEAVQRNRLGDANAYLEEAVELGTTMASTHPRPDILWGYATARAQLGFALVKMGAQPEAIPHLEEAATVMPRLVSWDPQIESHLPSVLVELAKAYRGPVAYAVMGGDAIFDLDEMRTYRIEQMENGTWPRGMLTLESDEQKAKAAAPLNEAIPILRRLVRADRATHEGKLAFALNLLGETYIEAERFADAEPLLREAEAMYRLLVQRNPAFQDMLTDTLQLLRRIPAANPGLADRISALEELLPMLRAEGKITQQEKEVGVTLAKSAARDRLRQAVKELSGLYREAGMADKHAGLRDEVNTLLMESLTIRWG